MRSFFSHRPVMIILLLIISTLHGLVFSTAQDSVWLFSGTLGAGLMESEPWLSIPLYISGVGAALWNQGLCRRYGVKKVFLSGLIMNFVGLALFYVSYFAYPASPAIAYFAIALGMLSLGAAISSVATVLASYVIVEFPKALALGLILLYSFLNFGVMFSNYIFSYFSQMHLQNAYLLGLTVVMAFFIFLIHAYFRDPQIPKFLDEKRNMGELWRKIRLRLVLFVAAMMLYGMIEYTFNLYGYDFVTAKVSKEDAATATMVFWLALNIGQIGIGLPAFWIRPSRVLLILPIFIIVGLALMPFQSNMGEFVLALIIGGFGCSAVFPLLLAMLAFEVMDRDRDPSHVHAIPQLEASCGYMVAAYTLGTGLVYFQKSFHPVSALATPFFTAIGFAIILGFLAVYFDKTAPRKVF